MGRACPPSKMIDWESFINLEGMQELLQKKKMGFRREALVILAG